MISIYVVVNAFDKVVIHFTVFGDSEQVALVGKLTPAINTIFFGAGSKMIDNCTLTT